MRIAQTIAAVLVLFACAGCSTLKTFARLGDQIDLETFGKDFDDLCVAGKVKSGSAAWLNANQDQWKQHRDFTDPRQPEPIRKNDRLFNGDCSEVTKRLGEKDFKGALEALDAVSRGGE